MLLTWQVSALEVFDNLNNCDARKGDWLQVYAERKTGTFTAISKY